MIEQLFANSGRPSQESDDTEELQIYDVQPARLIPGQENKIVLKAKGLSSYTWLEVEDCETKSTKQISPYELEALVVPKDSNGLKDITVVRGRADESTFAGVVAIIGLPDPETTPQYSDRGWLLLDKTQSLNIGTGKTKGGKPVDIRHYKNAPINRKDLGVTISKNGYMAFWGLKWDKTKEIRTTSFVFFVSGSNTIYFGLGGENVFNWSSNSVYEADLAVRIYRNRGMYAKYANGGTDESGFYSFDIYSYQKRNCYYRLDITNNGDRGQKFLLYMLESEKIADWDKGRLVQEYDVPLCAPLNGKVLIPVVLGSNATSPVLGVRAI